MLLELSLLFLVTKEVILGVGCYHWNASCWSHRAVFPINLPPYILWALNLVCLISSSLCCSFFFFFVSFFALKKFFFLRTFFFLTEEDWGGENHCQLIDFFTRCFSIITLAVSPFCVNCILKKNPSSAEILLGIVTNSVSYFLWRKIVLWEQPCLEL